MIDQDELFSQITNKTLEVQKIGLENISKDDNEEFCVIAESLAVSSQMLAIYNVIMKSFLTYTIVCALLTILLFRKFDVQPMVILFINLAIGACISAWMTYRLYLCSTRIERVLSTYDVFVKKISQKEKS